MKILLLGANGQIGQELQRRLASLGQVKVCDRRAANLEKLDDLKEIIRSYSPAVIVNAAGYTSVDNAESEPDIAFKVNAEAVGLLANETNLLNALLVHYSTDYVFDGAKSEAYIEGDEPNPQSVYGKTKLQGEQAITQSGCKHIIFRTSWVHATHGSNFVKTILRLAVERDELKVVADQFGTPTSAALIADLTALCLDRLTNKNVFSEKAFGIYHLAAAGETNRCAFARYIIAEAQNCGIMMRVMPENIFPISTSDYPLPARRPANSCLNTQKLVDTFDVHLPPWQTDVNRTIIELAQDGAV